MLETLTVERIKLIKPKDYNPVERGYMDSDWEGTIADFLKIKEIPPRDRLWVACQDNLIDDKILRLFAVWCARESLKTVKDPDPRSFKACDVVEAYAHGKATEEELEEAKIATYCGTYCATIEAANTAAYYTACFAAHCAAHRTENRATNKYNAVNREKEHIKQVEKLIAMVENHGK